MASRVPSTSGFSPGSAAATGRLALRSAASSPAALSQIVDTLLFITISFYGVLPICDLHPGQMLAKVVLSAVLVPPLITLLVVAIGRRMDARG